MFVSCLCFSRMERHIGPYRARWCNWKFINYNWLNWMWNRVEICLLSAMNGVEKLNRILRRINWTEISDRQTRAMNFYSIVASRHSLAVSSRNSNSIHKKKVQLFHSILILLSCSSQSHFDFSIIPIDIRYRMPSRYTQTSFGGTWQTEVKVKVNRIYVYRIIMLCVLSTYPNNFVPISEWFF